MTTATHDIVEESHAPAIRSNGDLARLALGSYHTDGFGRA